MTRVGEGGMRRRGAARANAPAACTFTTISIAMMVVHLTGVVTSLELMPSGPPLEEEQLPPVATTAPREAGEVGDDGDRRGADATAAARWERDMMSPAAYGGGGGGTGGDHGGIEGVPRAVSDGSGSGSHHGRRAGVRVGGGGGADMGGGGVGGGAPRALLQVESTTACGPGAAVNRATATCANCTAGTYASGRTALCRFPEVRLSCGAALDPAAFLGTYGFNDSLAANCTFTTDAARFVSGDAASCSFADIGVLQCASSATIGVDESVTFSLRCPGAVGDPIFQDCAGLIEGATARCAWEGNQENCTSCPPGSACESPGTADPLPCPRGSACPDGNTRQLCSPGTYSQGGALTCSPCDLGQYQEDEGSSSCRECPAGTFCWRPGISDLTNYYCQVGTYSRFILNDTAFTALPYDHADAHRLPTLDARGDARCRVCPVGYTCPSPDTPPALCPAGTTRVGSNYTHCVECPVGAYCPTPNVPPAACPSGSFSGVGQNACTECTAGYYCPDTEVNLQLRCDVVRRREGENRGRGGGGERGRCPATERVLDCGAVNCTNTRHTKIKLNFKKIKNKCFTT